MLYNLFENRDFVSVFAVALLAEGVDRNLKAHKYKSFPTAVEAARNGKKLVFIFLDWETYGDRSYYYCKEDDTVYSDYLSIGD